MTTRKIKIAGLLGAAGLAGGTIVGLTPADAHVGTYAHANVTWAPKPKCIELRKVNGPVGGRWKLDKFAHAYSGINNGVPNVLLGGRCARRDTFGVVKVDQVKRDFCGWAYVGGKILLAVDTSGPDCSGERYADYGCTSLYRMLGGHLYRRNHAGIAEGCGRVPSIAAQVGSDEKRALASAW